MVIPSHWLLLLVAAACGGLLTILWQAWRDAVAERRHRLTTGQVEEVLAHVEAMAERVRYLTPEFVSEFDDTVESDSNEIPF